MQVKSEEAGSEKVPEDLKHRTKQFALRVLKLCRSLPAEPEPQAVRRQLVRCGTSVAANYRASQRAKSRKDFAHKLATVEEEADETCFWLELIIEDGMMPAGLVEPLYQEASEITAIVTAGVRTARRNKDMK